MTLDGSRPLLTAVVVGCALLAALVALVGRLGQSPAILRASGRAAVQLVVVATVVGAALASLPLSLAYVGLMLAVASVTAARRLTRQPSGAWAVLPVAAGAVPVVALLLATGLVPPVGTAVVPVGGILVGGAMTATVLAGRRCLDTLRDRVGEVEAAMALGLPRRDAVTLTVRPEAALALVPTLDQTRTVGLVTLPGAFVGMLLGGASAADAAAVQLVVLVALLLVQALSVVLVVEIVARGHLRR